MFLDGVSKSVVDSLDGAARQVMLKGSESQIESARMLIFEKVEEEKRMRKNALSNRTKRAGGAAGASCRGGRNSHTLLPNGVLEVFVSCVYHPNYFWIQGNKLIKYRNSNAVNSFQMFH